MENGWYAVDRGQSVGPMTLDQLAQRLPSLGGPAAMVFGPGMAAWTPAGQVPAIAHRMNAAGPGGPPGLPPPPPGYPAGQFGGRRADVIDYEVHGSEMQYVEVTLDPGEMAIGEPGGMMYMEPG